MNSLPSRTYRRRCFVAVQRPRAAAAEDRDLVPGLVHRAVAIEALRHRERRRVRVIGGDERWRRPRAEPVVAGLSSGENSCTTCRPFWPSARNAKPLALVMPIFTSWQVVDLPAAR